MLDANCAIEGCVGVRSFSIEIAELKRLYVAKPFRNTGLGRALCTAAIQSAKSLRYNSIRLDTSNRCTAALRLFRGLGFYEIPRYNADPYAEVFMEKLLFSIRRFEPRDQDEVREVVLEGLGGHFGFIDPTRNPDLNAIQKAYLDAGHEFFVAEFDGGIVGTVGLTYEEGRARIVRMSVAETHRRKGIARALLERCIAATAARGLREIVASTEPHWADAIGFYRASGFEIYGRDQVDVHLALRLSEGVDEPSEPTTL